MDKEQIFNIVINHSRELMPELEEHTFQYTDRLTDLGANSVDRAEIVMMTMESLSLQIPRVELFGATNIGELVDLIYDKMQLV
ncbi:acyl carrier protein [Paenibacillus agilis]|uniref:Acyl carrier protein n=1 Tax=Paenibacillus agilis TaxID=3020863 RepID=A0A559IX48_9BACL|nr:acyl carrier protein [Paenibacillus agilis]TVX92166.1 acyl carrier protein [Paenibacillus agilis]